MSASPPPGSAAASDADLILAVAGARPGGLRRAVRALRRADQGLRDARAAPAPADADEIAQDVMVAIWRRAAASTRRAPPPRPGSSRSPATGASTSLRRAGRPGPDPRDPLFQPDPEPDGFARARAPPSARRGCATASPASPPEQRRGAGRRLLRRAEPRRDRRARGPAARHGEVADPARLPPPARRYWARIWRRGSAMTERGADGRGLARRRAPSRATAATR